MPYIIDEDNMLFCKASFKDRCIEEDAGCPFPHGSNGTPYQAYDVYTSDLEGNNEFFVETGYGVKTISCTPTCFTSNGITNLNYSMALVSAGSLRHHYFNRCGTSLQDLGSAKRTRNKWGIRAHSASETKRYVFTPYCALNVPYFFATDKQYGVDSKYVLSCTQLKRLVPIANDDKNVIILSLNDNRVISSIVNLDTLVVKDIKVNNKDVYKCSILGDTIIHTVKGLGSSYSRQLHKDSYTLVDSTIKVSVQ